MCKENSENTTSGLNFGSAQSAQELTEDEERAAKWVDPETLQIMRNLCDGMRGPRSPLRDVHFQNDRSVICIVEHPISSQLYTVHIKRIKQPDECQCEDEHGNALNKCDECPR